MVKRSVGAGRLHFTTADRVKAAITEELAKRWVDTPLRPGHSAANHPERFANTSGTNRVVEGLACYELGSGMRLIGEGWRR